MQKNLTLYKSANNLVREKYLSTIVEIQEHLYDNSGKVSDKWNYVLQLLGDVTNASRVYIFINSVSETGRNKTSQIAEWCAPGISRELHNPDMQFVDYETHLSGLYSKLSRGETVNSLTNKFSEPFKNILEAQNIFSVLLLPIIVSSKFYGFIGFDNCIADYIFEDDEVNLLKIVSKALGSCIEREETELQISRKEERYRLLFENNPLPMFVYHPFTDRILAANNSAVEVYGYSSKELMSSTLKSLLSEDELAYKEDFLKPLLLKKGTQDSIISRHKTKYGYNIDVELIMHDFLHEGISSKLVVVNDITEGLKSQQILQETQTRLATILNNLSNLVLYETGLGRNFISQNIENMLGYPVSEFTENPHYFSKLIHPDDEEYVNTSLNKWLKQGSGVLTLEFRCRKSNGEYIWLEDHIIKINTDDESGFITGILIDITQRKVAEEQVKTTNLRLATIFKNTPDVILYETGIGRQFISANVYDLLGIDADKFVNDRQVYINLIHPDDKVNIRSRIIKWRKQGEKNVLVLQYRIKDKSGNYIWVEDHMVNVSTTTIKYRAGVILNINEKKNSEEAIKSSEERFRALIQNSSDVVTIIDASGVIKFESPSVEKILGYTTDERLSRNFFEFIHEDESLECKSQFKKSFSLTEGLITLRYRVRHKKGYWVYFESYVNNLLENDIINGIIVNSRDITERWIAENSLKESQHFIESITDTMPSSIYVYDLEKRKYIYTNKDVALSLGYTEEEVNTNRDALFKRMMDPEDERHYEKRLRGYEQLKDKELLETEYRLRHADGEWRWFISRDIIFKRNEAGKPVQILGIAQEITEKRLAQEELIRAKEEAVVANKAKSDFLATMSHEIRTPLNGIIGMTGLLLETEMSEDQQDLSNMIRVSGDTLMNLINDILDFSKIESGKMDLEEQPFVINQCMEDVIDLLGSKAGSKNLELIYNIDSRIPDFVKGDITRLRQILVNLVSNAVKFTQEGFIKIDSQLIERTQSSLKIQFKIEDSGIGIPNEKINKLFKAFTQIDSSTTRKYGGTGLGLAICNQLVKLMGGKIWVESELGKGTSFYFTIQVKPSVNVKSDKLKRLELKNKKILLISNNNTISEAFKSICKPWGVNLFTASDYTEASRFISSNEELTAAVINLDNDNELEHVKSGILCEAGSENLPVIYLTNKTRTDDLALNGSSNSIYLHKPLKHSQIYNSFKNILEKHDVKDKALPKKKLDVELAKKKPMRILIAEDNLINQKLIERILQQMGYVPDLVMNGLEVLEALKRKKYNLIFMDIQMPEMDGLKATKEIINIYKELKPSIVAMTANAMQGDREKCLAAGMDDYISKPIFIEDIQNILLKWGDNKNGSE